MCFPILEGILLSVQGPDFELIHTRTSFSCTLRGMRIMHSLNPTIVHVGGGMNNNFDMGGQGNGHAAGDGIWVQPPLHFPVNHHDVGNISGLLRAVRNSLRAATQRARQLGAATVEGYRELGRDLATVGPVRLCMLLVLGILLAPLLLAGATMLFWLGIAWLALQGIHHVSDRVARLTKQLLGGPGATTIATIGNTARGWLAYLTKRTASTEPNPAPGLPAQRQQDRPSLSVQPLPGRQPDSGQEVTDQQPADQQTEDHKASNQQDPVQHPADQQA
ncbi:hypothetical protein VTH06DRAFT_1552 [Thermothelomyces fergusii]